MWIIWGVEAVAIAIGILLAISVGRGSENQLRTTVMAVALFGVALLGLIIYTLASVNYAIPVAWIVAMAVAAVSTLGLLVACSMAVKWRATRVLAVIGVVVAAWLAYGGLTSFGVGHEQMMPLVMDRAVQIGEAGGFMPLVAPDYEISFGYDGYAVSPTEGSPPGLAIDYSSSQREGMGFLLQERKATGLSVDGLARLVAVGTNPTGGERETITAGGAVTTATVQGQPAVGVWYPFQERGADKMGKSTDGASTKVFARAVLVFELDGVEVRMSSGAGEANPDPGWTQQSLVDELLTIAQTLEPVR